MRKKLCLLMACLMFTTGTEVFAASEDYPNQMRSDDGKAVESIYYENDEEIVNYSDFSVIGDEPAVSQNSSAECIGAAMAKSTAPTYNSSLQPINNYSSLWAWSQSTSGIDYMAVSVTAYRDNGTYIGTEREVSKSGFKVGALSAYVTPLDLGLNYKVGKGVSSHYYRCDGYKDVTHNLQWKK